MQIVHTSAVTQWMAKKTWLYFLSEIELSDQSEKSDGIKSWI